MTASGCCVASVYTECHKLDVVMLADVPAAAAAACMPAHACMQCMLIATVLVSRMLPSDTTLLLLSQLIAALLLSCTLSSSPIPCIVLVLVLYDLSIILRMLSVVYGMARLSYCDCCC